jgi:predicted secreted protein
MQAGTKNIVIRGLELTVYDAFLEASRSPKPCCYHVPRQTGDARRSSGAGCGCRYREDVVRCEEEKKVEAAVAEELGFVAGAASHLPGPCQARVNPESLCT